MRYTTLNHLGFAVKEKEIACASNFTATYLSMHVIQCVGVFAISRVKFS